MFKKILAAACCLMLIFAVGCDKTVVYDNLSDYETESETEVTANNFSTNPLTGTEVSKEISASGTASRNIQSWHQLGCWRTVC